MNAEQALVIYDTVRGALTAEMNFPQIVGRLAQIGVERYHVDYSRREQTFYLAGGESLVVETPWLGFPIAVDFAAPSVQAAVQQSQRGEHSYTDFVRKTSAAGCVGYSVQIAGRRVMYFGRKGDVHTEWFPGVHDK